MKGSGCSFYLTIILIFLSVAAIGQTKEELQDKKKKLLEEIEYTNELINKTKASQTNSMDELVKLNKKIETRAEIIETINQEVNLLEKKIAKNKAVIASLESDLQELKEEYSKMLYYTYKNRSSYNRLLFLFSSTDFNQAYKRLNYMQQCTSYRKRQAQLIVKTKNSIDNKIAGLEKIRTEKKVLLNSLENERKNYTMEKVEQEGVLSNLKKQESDLLKELNRKQRTAEKLQRAIEEIIREEIRKARAKIIAKLGCTNKEKPSSLDSSSAIFANGIGHKSSITFKGK